MYIVTGQQSTDEVVCLATGSATIAGLRVYNPSSSVVNLEVRAYDYSKSLEIGLSRHSLSPDSTTSLGGEIILNDLDEAYVSGNSSNENLQYTYGLSGDTSKTFIGLNYYNDDPEYLSSPSFSPPNVVIKAFNANSSTAELSLQAHENSNSLTNNKFVNNISAGQSRKIGYPPFDSYDYSLADNQVAHPFDLCIYAEGSRGSEYCSFTHFAYNDLHKVLANWKVYKIFKINNITCGTPNPVDLHIRFMNIPYTERDTQQGNRIQLNTTGTDANGTITDAYIDVYPAIQTDWGSAFAGGWGYWDVSTYKYADGRIRPNAHLRSIGHSGSSWNNHVTGFMEVQFFISGSISSRTAPVEVREVASMSDWPNMCPIDTSSPSLYPYHNCGLGPTQVYWANTFVPYDPVREGNWLDLAGGG